MQDRAIATPHLLKYNILVEFMSLRIVRAFIGQTRPGAARRRSNGEGTGGDYSIKMDIFYVKEMN